jgi:hypothetical protein
MTSVPRAVQQDKNQMHCWAAALYSWMIATRRKGKSATPIKDYKNLIDQYSDLDDGGISEKQLTTVVAVDFNMNFSRGTGDLQESVIESRLRKNGYVLLIYKSSLQSSHTLVLYGVGNAKIKDMDPWYGLLREYPLTDFNGKKPPLAKMMMYPS